MGKPDKKPYSQRAAGMKQPQTMTEPQKEAVRMPFPSLWATPSLLPISIFPALPRGRGSSHSAFPISRKLRERGRKPSPCRRERLLLSCHSNNGPVKRSAVASSKGEIGEKVLSTLCVGDETATFHDRAKPKKGNPSPERFPSIQAVPSFYIWLFEIIKNNILQLEK